MILDKNLYSVEKMYQLFFHPNTSKNMPWMSKVQLRVLKLLPSHSIFQPCTPKNILFMSEI